MLGLADYVLRPDSYHFGTEVAGFRYVSSLHYVGSILVTCLVGTLALAGRRLFGSARLAMTIRMGVAAAFVALIFASSPK